MKTLRFAIATALLLLASFTARAQWDASTNVLFMITPPTNITASGLAPYSFTNQGYAGSAAFIVQGASTNGSSPTLAVQLIGSGDQSHWTNITSGLFTTLTTNGQQVIYIPHIYEQALYISATNTLGGTSTPAFIYSIGVLVPQQRRNTQ